MKYIAIYDSEMLHKVEPVSGNSKVFTNKSSIVETDRQALIDMLLFKGFTQAEIDAKLPEEEEV